MIEGMVATVAILGGTCAFMWYLFNSMEYRFSVKFDHLQERLDGVVSDLENQRKRTDHLYEVSIQLMKEIQQTNNPRQKKAAK